MKRICDLHTHSVYSDGTFTPTEILDEAERIGLSAVVLSDHNTVAGLPSFLAAAEGREVEAVPGVEFSTDYQGTELHILGLWIGEVHYGAVTEFLHEMLVRKEKSNEDLVQRLQTAGICLDYEKIRSAAPDGVVNRGVIAGHMVRLGYANSVQEAFQKWLSPKRGYFVPPQRLNVLEVIRFIKSIGAVAVLAHPFLNLEETDLRAFLPVAKEAGLDGMETVYPLFDPEKTALAKKIAEEYGILESGGSDFHGENKPDIALGFGKNNIAVPTSFLEKLRRRAQ